MEIFANLHLHSTHSDGKYTPAELVQLAKEEGYELSEKELEALCGGLWGYGA